MRISLVALMNILRRESDTPLIIQNCTNKKLFWIKQFEGEDVSDCLTYDSEQQTAFAISNGWSKVLHGVVKDAKSQASIDDLTEEDWKELYERDDEEQRNFTRLAHEHDSGIPTRASLL